MRAAAHRAPSSHRRRHDFEEIHSFPGCIGAPVRSGRIAASSAVFLPPPAFRPLTRAQWGLGAVPGPGPAFAFAEGRNAYAPFWCPAAAATELPSRYHVVSMALQGLSRLVDKRR